MPDAGLNLVLLDATDAIGTNRGPINTEWDRMLNQGWTKSRPGPSRWTWQQPKVDTTIPGAIAISGTDPVAAGTLYFAFTDLDGINRQSYFASLKAGDWVIVTSPSGVIKYHLAVKTGTTDITLLMTGADTVLVSGTAPGNGAPATVTLQLA
jgi:hypothetical protein